MRSLNLPKRRTVTIAIALATLALVVGGCGSGSEPTFEGQRVLSADDILELLIPEGAAPDDIELHAEPISSGDLPGSLRDTPLIVVGYAIDPAGTILSQPATVTVRLDPNDFDIDLPDGAVPIGLILTEDDEGELAGLEDAVISRDGDAVVATAAVTSLRPAIFVFSNNVALAMGPKQMELVVGESASAGVDIIDLGTGEFAGEDQLPVKVGDVSWDATAPFEIGGSTGMFEHSVEVSCSSRTDGWVEDAYRVDVTAGWRGGATPTHAVELFMALLTGEIEIRLAGDGKCNAADDEETPEPTSTSASGSGSSSGASATPSSPVATVGPRSASNSGYDISVSGSSGDTPVDENDCYGDDAPLDECPGAVDIVHMAWEMDGDQPDLLEVTVTFAGPYAGTDTTIMSVTVWGDDTNNFTVQAILEDGEVSCKYPGQPDSPLPGESCEVNSSGQVEVALDVSGTAGGFRVSARSFQLGGGDRKEDKVYLVGIERP